MLFIHLAGENASPTLVGLLFLEVVLAKAGPCTHPPSPCSLVLSLFLPLSPHLLSPSLSPSPSYLSILSLHPISPSYLSILSLHPISPSYLSILSLHPISPSYLSILSLHPISPSYLSILVLPSQVTVCISYPLQLYHNETLILSAIKHLYHSPHRSCFVMFFSHI